MGTKRAHSIVCPIFAWRIPRILEEYLREVTLVGSLKVYLLVTACGSSGNAGAYAQKFFASIHKELLGWYTFHMPGSYVAFMENPDLMRAPEMNRQAVQDLSALIPHIRSEEGLSPYPVSKLGKFMSWAANPFFYRFIIGRNDFYTTSRCIGCGKCAAACPLNNIQMSKGSPMWGDQCTHCMACIYQCPEKAVEFRKISIGKNRYYNPGYKK